ncbi:lmo0937 family membrane protein [Thermodesulfobacteriota bacterium]
MLWTIVIILLVIWALGLATSSTVGGALHILLAIALVMIVINLFQGRRVV